MTALLRAEWIKLTKRKLLWIVLGIVVFLTAFGAFFQFAAADLFDDPDLVGLDVPTKPEAYLIGFQNAAGNTWVAVILAAVLAGSEFAKGTWSISLTWEARRWLHLVAKLVAISVGAAALALVAVLVWGLFAGTLADGEGIPSIAEFGLATVKLGLIQTVWVSVGLAAAALLRSTGLAVGLALGFTFVEQLLVLWEPYRDISVTAATTGLFGLEVFGIPGDPSLPDPLHSALILLVWVAIAGGVAWAAITYRDA